MWLFIIGVIRTIGTTYMYVLPVLSINTSVTVAMLLLLPCRKVSVGIVIGAVRRFISENSSLGGRNFLCKSLHSIEVCLDTVCVPIPVVVCAPIPVVVCVYLYL